MENNFGKINAIFLQNTEGLLKSKVGKGVVREYVQKIKNSNLLSKQFSLYESIESVEYTDDVKDYIVECFNYFSDVNQVELNKQTIALSSLLENNNIKQIGEIKNEKLYENINNLIYLKKSIKNISNKVENINSIVEHIKTKKPILKEEKSSEKFNLTDSSLKFILSKFNQKYSDKLDESEKKIFKTIVSTKEEDKKELYENLKKDCLTLTNSFLKESIDSTTKEKLLTVKETLLEESFNKDNFIEDVIRFIDLKETLNIE